MGAVEDAVAALRAGESVVLPTDTVYGLCASPDAAEPVERALELKGRAAGQPAALLCADVDALFERIPELEPRHRVVAAVLLPGPYTLVLPNRGRRYRWLTGSSSDTIGVRVPELTGAAAEVVRAVGAVMATSANRHGKPDPATLEDVPAEIRNECGAVIDGGRLPGMPSTVLDLTGREPVVLREGAVAAAAALTEVAAALGAAA